jgi:hypothetical protein
LWWGDGWSRLTFNSKTLIEIHPAYPAVLAGRGGNVLSAEVARTFTLSLCEALSLDDLQKQWIMIRKNSTSIPLMYSYHSSSLYLNIWRKGNNKDHPAEAIDNNMDEYHIRIYS